MHLLTPLKLRSRGFCSLSRFAVFLSLCGRQVEVKWNGLCVWFRLVYQRLTSGFHSIIKQIIAQLMKIGHGQRAELYILTPVEEMATVQFHHAVSA